MIHILNRITEHLLVDKWADCFRCSGASNAVPGRRQLATAGRSDISRVASAYAFLVQPPIRDRSPGSTVVAPLDAKDLSASQTRMRCGFMMELGGLEPPTSRCDR